MPPSRRDELIEAAVRVFSRNGFHSSGVEMVLQEAGVSRMTLYNHFKSKDELIVAALRRKDETFRNNLMRFVDSAASDPVQRILAVFDFYKRWFTSKDFTGCMFINASGEYPDSTSPIRRVAADTRRDMQSYLASLCADADLQEPERIAAELDLLLEGATANAQIFNQAHGNDDPGAPARLAKSVAQRLLAAELRRD